MLKKNQPAKLVLVLVGSSGTTFGGGVKENNYLGKGIGLTASFSLSEDELKGEFSVNNPNFANTGDFRFFSTKQ